MGVQRFESIISAQSVGTQDVEKLAQSFERLAGTIEKTSDKANKVSEHPGFDSFAAKVKSGIQDPLGAAGTAIEGLLKSAGPMGTVFAGGVGIFTTLGVAGFEAARSLGSLSDSLQDTGVRMGLTVEEVQRVSIAMKYAGGNIESVEGWMRKLSQEIETGGTHLRKMGIEYQDFATGKARPMLEILLQLSARWAGMTETTKRNAEATAIAGKSALAALPDLMDLADGMQHTGGRIFSTETVNEFDKWRKGIADIDRDWDFLLKKLKQGVAIPFMWLLGGAEKSSPTPGAGGGFGDWLLGLFSGATTGPGGKPGQSWGPGPLRFSYDPRDQMSPGFRAQLDAADAAAKKSAEPTSEQLAAIARNDARVLAIGTDAERLSREKTKIEDLFKSLKIGVLPEVNAPTFDAIGKERAVIDAIEARIKKTEDLKAAEKELVAFELSMAEKAADPIAKIFVQRDALIKKGADPERANTAARLAASELLAKGEQENFEKNQVILGKLADMESKAWQKVYEDAGTAAERLADLFIKTSQRVADISTAGRVSRTGMFGQHQVDMLGLAAGPGQEGALVNAQFREQLTTAEKIYEIQVAAAKVEQDGSRRRELMAQAFATLETARFDAELQHELRIGEMQRHRLDELRNLSGQFFDSLTRGPEGIKQFFTGLAMGEVRKVFQNIVESGFGGKSPHLGLPGRIFQGTVFGTDPLAGATQANTLATMENTLALRAIAAMGSGVSAGGFSSAAGTFAGLSSGEGLGEGHGLPTDGFPGDWGGEYSGGASGGMSLRRAFGIGGAAAAGGFGIYSGVRSGGARGALTASGSAMAAAGVIIGQLDKALKVLPVVGEIAGLGLGLATLFLPDKKLARDKEESARLAEARYFAPAATNYTRDRYGRDYDSDVSGNLRPVVIVNAIDTKSFIDHAPAIAEALAVELEARRSPRVSQALRNTVR